MCSTQLPRRPRPTVLALALLGLTAAGCWVPAQTGKQMRRDIRDLQQQMQTAEHSLEAQQARLEEQMQRADEKIDEVAKTLRELNKAARRTDADFGVQIERLIKEVQELRGTLELTQYRVDKMEKVVKDGDGSLIARVEALEGGGTPSNNDGSDTEDATGSTPLSERPPPKDKKKLVAYGKALMEEESYERARGVFRDVIQKWPKAPGITDQAYYRLGDIYFKEGEYRRALQEFIKIVETFGKGAYADNAYFRIGQCSRELGNLEDAKIFFAEVVRNHPRSPLRKSARRQLREVNRRLENNTD